MIEIMCFLVIRCWAYTHSCFSLLLSFFLGEDLSVFQSCIYSIRSLWDTWQGSRYVILEQRISVQRPTVYLTPRVRQAQQGRSPVLRLQLGLSPSGRLRARHKPGHSFRVSQKWIFWVRGPLICKTQTVCLT